MDAHPEWGSSLLAPFGVAMCTVVCLSRAAVASRAAWKRAATMEQVRRAAALPSQELSAVASEMKLEMSRGLHGEPASLKMLPSHVSRLPRGTETGVFYALDLGGTNFRIIRVELSDQRPPLTEAWELGIPEAAMRGHQASDLFGFLASSLKSAIGEEVAAAPETPLLGFTFSFPVRQTGLGSGTLISWTKGFSCGGVEGEDVVSLLQAELDRAGVRLRVAALVNDTVGLLAAARYADPGAEVAVILGTGTNACYMEAALPKGERGAAGGGPMVVNMEWGGFTAECLPWLPADRVLDGCSINPGEQHFEKMVSGMYLGEVVRLCLAEVEQAGGLQVAGGGASAGLRAPYALATATVNAVDADSSEGMEQARRALEEELGLGPGSAPMVTRGVLKELCGLVRRRAARLAGAGVVAVLRHLEWPVEETPVTVAVDGGMYEHYAQYRADMEAAIREMLGEKSKVQCRLTNDGSGLGAALVAAATTHA